MKHCVAAGDGRGRSEELRGRDLLLGNAQGENSGGEMFGGVDGAIDAHDLLSAADLDVIGEGELVMSETGPPLRA